MNVVLLFCDLLTNNSILNVTSLLELSIIPATVVLQYCATFPEACGAIIANERNSGTK